LIPFRPETLYSHLRLRRGHSYPMVLSYPDADSARQCYDDWNPGVPGCPWSWYSFRKPNIYFDMIPSDHEKFFTIEGHVPGHCGLIWPNGISSQHGDCPYTGALIVPYAEVIKPDSGTYPGFTLADRADSDGDGVPDYVDGYGLFGGATAGPVAFLPITIK